MKKYILLLFLFKSYSILAQETKLLIGTYTSGKSEGIYVYNFNLSNGENSFLSSIKSSNPSYLAVSGKYVYAVNEDADTTKENYGGRITAYTFDKTKGTLTELNSKSSGGLHPCYVTVDRFGKWIFAANYTSGTIGLLSTNDDGTIKELKTSIQHTGNGPNPQRQKSPHIHATFLSPNEKYLYVPDLGIDKVVVYKFNAKKGTLKKSSEAISIPGSGPRHLSLHPNNNYIYLMEELTGTVVCYKMKNGKLKLVQRLSALSPSFKGAIGSADIHTSPDGNFLYCTNRGESNTISIFKINTANGKLELLKEQSTMGNKPRNFSLDPTGEFLLVANQESNTIVIFKVDKLTGMLTDTGKRINVPNPVCLKWIN